MNVFLIIQEVPELATSFDAVTKFFLPAVVGAISVLAMDAAKHAFRPEWSWGVFLADKIKPLALSVAGGVGIYYIFAYVPFLKPYLEMFAEQELAEFNATAIMGFATALIDGALKRFKKSKEAANE